MGCKLYVGNLSWAATEEELTQHFAQHGKVRSAKIIMDRETQRSRGFAFVEYETDLEAQAAIQAENGQEFLGRALNVNEAQDKRQDGPRRESVAPRGREIAVPVQEERPRRRQRTRRDHDDY